MINFCTEPGWSVRAIKVCPHMDCNWSIAVSWRRDGAIEFRDLWGSDLESILQEHLETHLPPDVAALIGS